MNLTDLFNSGKYYFYCPNCRHEMLVNRLPHNTTPNIRDGYGIAINHYECEWCGNLDAGFMKVRNIEDFNMYHKKYYKSVISNYQGIRGFKKNEDD